MDANFFMIARTDADTDKDDLRVLDSLDVAADSLQRQGKSEKALEYMQMALRFRRRLYGDRNEATAEYCRAMLKTALSSAGKRLESADGPGAIGILEAVQHALSGLPLDPFASEICGLYNTLALAHRRKGDFQAAKRHIAKALQIAETNPNAQIDRAAAHLNMCVLQSTLKQHKEALASGLKAVQFAQEDLVNASLSDQSVKSEKVSVLAVAYHNVGVEQEHLTRLKEAVEWYSRASRLLDTHGKNSELQAQVQRTLKAAIQALETREKSPDTLLWKRKTVRASETTPRLVSSAHPRIDHKSKAGKHSVRSLMSPRKVESMIRSSEAAREDTPPNVYQQFAIANAFQPLTIPPVPSIHDLSDTDQDIHDLEAMGLLEYSLDTGRASPRSTRPALIRVRGRKRFTRYQSEASTRKGISPLDERRKSVADSWDVEDAGKPQPLTIGELDLPKVRKEAGTPKLTARNEVSSEKQKSLKVRSETHIRKTLPMKPSAGENQPAKQASAVPTPQIQKQTSPHPDPSLDVEMEKAATLIQNAFRNKMKRRVKAPQSPPQADPKVVERAAIKIQTRFRAFLARRKARLLKAGQQRVLHRCCKKLSDGTFVTVSIRRDNSAMIVSASDSDSTRELTVSPGSTLPPSEIAAKVDSDTEGHLFLPDPELTKAAVSIQALFRGKKTRERLKVEMAHRSPEFARRSSEFGSEFVPEKKRPPDARSKPRDLLSSLSKALQPELKLSVPFQIEGKTKAELSREIEQDIIPRLSIEGGKMVLEPQMQPGDEKKVTLMQSMFRMKLEKKRYNQLKAEQEAGEVLARGEKTIDGGSYLITFLRKSESFEVDAYPLTKGFQKPESYTRTESEVREVLGWGPDKQWVGSESEAIAAVEIRELKVVLIGVLFQAEDGLGTPDQFLVQVFRTPPTIKVVARPQSTELPQPEPLFIEETTLRDMLGVDEEWAPVHWRDLLYRLQVTENRLSLPAQASQPPSIVVLTTATANILGTENYHRIEPETHVINPALIEPAAVRIQACYRGFQARRQAAEKRGKKPALRFFFLREKLSVAVSVWHEPPLFQVEVVELGAMTATKSAIAAEDPLNAANIVLGRLNKRESAPQSPPKKLEKPAKTLPKAIESSVIRIQKHVRGLIARSLYAKLKAASQRKLKFTRRKVMNSEEFFIAIYAIKEMYQIESFKVNRSLQLQYHSQFINITCKKLQALYQQMPTFEVIYEDVTILEGRFLLQPRIRYKAAPPDHHLLPNPNSSVLPGEPRTILRASKKLDTRMWVVTMSITDTKAGQANPQPGDKLEFSAFCGGVESALRVSETLGRLGQVTGQPVEAVHPIGFLVINHMLKVSGGSLILDFTVKLPSISSLITRVQAMIRGFLVRKKVKYEVRPFGLIACLPRHIDGADFLLYAYHDPKGIVLEAACKSPRQSFFCRLEGEEVLALPDNINRKKILEDFVLPRLRLTPKENAIQLSITKGEVPTMGLEAYVFKPKSGKKQSDFKSVGRAQAIIKSILDLPPKQLKDWTPSLSAPPVNPNPSLHPKVSLRLPSSDDKETAEEMKRPVFEIAEEAEESASTEKKPTGVLGRLFSSSISPIIHAPDTVKIDSPQIPKSMFPETAGVEPRKRPLSDTEFSAIFRRSSAKAELIVRSGLELLGELYTASVYDAKTALLVELLQMKTKEELKKETPLPTFSSTDERDQYCSELLNRISLSVDGEGRKYIEIAPAADSLQVLYRRSHYISDRYTVVTVTETSEEIVIWVHDPAKSQHLRLPIQKKQGSELDNTQREILMLVKRIKIEAVLGHETLVLAPA